VQLLDAVGPDAIEIRSGVADDELRDLYRRCGVSVLALTDGYANNALLEAMACGAAIVATDLPATREYLGGAGWLVPVGSASALITAVAEAIVDSPDVQRRRSAASERVARFTFERHADDFAQLVIDDAAPLAVDAAEPFVAMKRALSS
jgi:glycosyltransferase involved in cell wall biosynthesis